MKPYGSHKRPYESDRFKCSRGRADRLPPTADECDELTQAIAVEGEKVKLPDDDLHWRATLEEWDESHRTRHAPAMARIGFDILVTTEDGYDDEDDFINWAQCALDAFALPPGVKRVEVMRPAPDPDNPTGKNYR